MKGAVQNEKNHCRCAHISRMGILYLLYIEILDGMQLRTAVRRQRPQPLTSAMIIVRLTIELMGRRARPRYHRRGGLTLPRGLEDHPVTARIEALFE